MSDEKQELTVRKSESNGSILNDAEDASFKDSGEAEQLNLEAVTTNSQGQSGWEWDTEVGTSERPVASRTRLLTDGCRNYSYEKLSNTRKTRWKQLSAHSNRMAKDDHCHDYGNKNYNMSILTATSFKLMANQQVHIPDEETSPFSDADLEAVERFKSDRVTVRNRFGNNHEAMQEREITENTEYKEIPQPVETISSKCLKHSYSSTNSIASPKAKPWFRWKLFWVYCGPGLLMSVAYLDPGNIESDLQAGGYHGYQLLWVLSVSTLLGLFLQVLAVRLGVVTGRNLADNCRLYYGNLDSKLLYLMMQLAIIGSDVQEIVGSAIAFRMLFGFPLWVGCLLTGLDTFTFLGLHVFGVRKLEAFFAFLIGIMCFCFFGTFFTSVPDAVPILEGLFIPKVGENASVQAVSILGAVVMPHNIYLHSALVLSRDIDRSKPEKIAEANKYFALEGGLALLVSLLINWAIVSVFAHGFYSEVCALESGDLIVPHTGETLSPPFACVPIHANNDGIVVKSELACVNERGISGSCMPIGLQGAQSALQALIGKGATILWAVGLLAAGQSSTMTGTYAGQFVMEGFLQLQIPNWVRVALTRTISLVPAVTVALVSQRSNSAAADSFDELLNVLQSLQLPFALLPLLVFTNSGEIMGESFKNTRNLRTMGFSAALVVLCVNAYLVYNTFSLESLPAPLIPVCLAFAVLYLYCLFRICRDAIQSSFASKEEPQSDIVFMESEKTRLIINGNANNSNANNGSNGTKYLEE